MADNDRQLALAFIAEMEKALAAIRSGDVDGISYAEVQPTSLFLLEGSTRIHALLRKNYRGLSLEGPKPLSELADSDVELATVISGFFEAVFDLINPEPSSGP